MALLSIVVLFAPLVVILSVSELTARLAVVVGALSIFLGFLSIFAHLRTADLFIAGAT